MRTAILDRVNHAGAVEDADLEVLPIDQAHLARVEFICGADFDEEWHAICKSESGDRISRQV